MRRAHRIALGSIFIECNNLTGRLTDLSAFERNEFLREDQLLTLKGGPIGGMLSVLRECRAEIAPLLVATACSAGPLTRPAYNFLKGELLDRLRAARPFDGVLLALHGAADVEGIGDQEGDLLAAIREIVTPKTPVVATLDLHAHVTEAMVDHADALLAWETYPHRDSFSTGVRGARMLLDLLGGRIRPAMAMAKVPVIVGAVRGNTEGQGPFADLMRYGKSLEGQGTVRSTSVFLVQPYLDSPGMGGGGLVITDNDLDHAVKLARGIAMRYWERRFELNPPVYSPSEAIRRGLEIEGGPVLLVETADCCGGGAAGDSVATLKALLSGGIEGPALVPVVDPEAAAKCHSAGAGSSVTLALGHKLDPQWGQPAMVSGTVRKLGDRRFRYTGGIWEGQTGDMGPCAVLETGVVQVLISTHATYDWADEQFRAMDLDMHNAKFIVVKNPMNYRLGYAGLSKAAFVLDTPGPTPATLERVAFQRLRRPYYPADSEIPGLEPVVFCRLSQAV
jgi:microcystin degradation protein MlrC